MNTKITYYQRNKQKCLDYYIKNREKEIIKKRKLRGGDIEAPIKEYKTIVERVKRPKEKSLKWVILNHYGCVCVCCGENDARFMTLDHKNNDGYKYRYKDGKKRKTGSAMYKDIINAGFPNDLQILCMNCNMGKQQNNGICPHQTTPLVY